MIEFCFSLQLVMAILTAPTTVAQNAAWQEALAARQCAVVEDPKFIAATWTSMRIVSEVSDLYVISGRLGDVEFWSWTGKTSEAGKQLLAERRQRGRP